MVEAKKYPISDLELCDKWAEFKLEFDLDVNDIFNNNCTLPTVFWFFRLKVFHFLATDPLLAETTVTSVRS